MNIYSKEIFNNSLIISKSQNDLIMRKRIQSANFTKIIKNRIFKGYSKIKFVNNKDFDLKLFLSKNPEEKYLPTSEKYNIYYENKFLSKYNTDTKNVSSLLKNSITNEKPKKKKSFKNKSISFCSKFDIDKTNFSTSRRLTRPFMQDFDNNKLNINSSKKIFKNKREENAFSKYPFVFFDRRPDNINNPKGLRNYPYYNPKYKQKNREQQYFLFTLSHHKEKKVKNLYRCLSSRTIHKKPIINKRIDNNSFKSNNKYNLVSFSYSSKKDNNLSLNKLINSDKIEKLKRVLIKKTTFNFFN